MLTVVSAPVAEDSRDASMSENEEQWAPAPIQGRTRLVVECLSEFDGPVSLADLADEVAVREHEVPITELTGDQVKRVYLSLYHTHIPKLANHGYLSYDQDADLVQPISELDTDGFDRSDRND